MTAEEKVVFATLIATCITKDSTLEQIRDIKNFLCQLQCSIQNIFIERLNERGEQ